MKAFKCGVCGDEIREFCLTGCRVAFCGCVSDDLYNLLMPIYVKHIHTEVNS